MMLHASRRRTIKAGLAAAAVAALPRTQTAAHQQQATPGPSAEGTIAAAQVESALSRLDALIEDGMTRTGVPGAAVAVVYGDEVVYERGFGVRELGKPEPVTPETVFQIASLSKPISSTLVAAVVGDGTTAWDTTIGGLDPGFALSDPWVSDQVTIRDMLCHRSGLPFYAGDPLIFDFGYSREECVHRLRAIPLTTPFRTTFAYTNLGFSAGAYAAAHAAGQAWEDLAEARLFAPLGMADTSFRFADFGKRENRAAPHYRTSDGVWKPGDLTNDDAAAPAGGVSSSLRDLTRWLRLSLNGGAFAGAQVVASDALHETHRPQVVIGTPPDPAAGPATFYGLGWTVTYDDRGRLVVSHAGDFNAYSTQATLLPASGLGIVVLCNGWPTAVRGAIPAAFLEMVTQGEPSQDWVSAIETSLSAALASILETAAGFPQGEPPAGAEPPLPLDAYTGAYTNAIYGEVTAREEGGGLMLAFGPNGAKRPLSPWNRDAFSMVRPGSEGVQVAQFGAIFIVGPDGRADAAQVVGMGAGPDALLTFTRVAGS